MPESKQEPKAVVVTATLLYIVSFLVQVTIAWWLLRDWWFPWLSWPQVFTVSYCITMIAQIARTVGKQSP